MRQQAPCAAGGEVADRGRSKPNGLPEKSGDVHHGQGPVVAIIVSYNPVADELQRLVALVAHQVDHVLVVDNGSREDVASVLTKVGQENLVFLKLGVNLGVGAAINRGVVWARQSRARRVVLFDQDSLPAADMLEKLTSELDRLESAGIAVAAVGPRFWDPRADNPPPFIRIRRGRVVRVLEKREHPVVEVDYLITSGSLIPIKTFDRVGLLEERLFIDYVDIEWGLRAKREGFRCFGVFPAKMQHSLGETPLRLVGARLPVHSALRHYYHFRNAIWLTRQAWVPLRWKFVNGYRLIGKFLIYSFLATPRLEHLRMMAKGVWHGFSDRLGQYT